MFAAGNVGTTLLPFLAGLVTVYYGWRFGFVVAVPLFAVVVVAVWWLVPGGAKDATRAFEGALALSLHRTVSAVRSPPVLLVSGAITCVVFGYQGLTAFLPTYLLVEKGLQPGTAATIYGSFFATGIVVQPLAGKLSDRFGNRRVLLVLAEMHILALAALPFVEGAAPLALLVVLLGFRAGLGPINNEYLIAALPGDVQGSGYGLIRTLYLGLGATGAVAVGALADVDLFDEAFLFLAGVLFVALAFYALLPARDALEA
jgi:predicted MFS family arabinose efflux permease